MVKQAILNEEEKKEVSKKFADRKEIYQEWKGKRKEIDRLASTLRMTIQDIAYALRENHGVYTQTAEYLGIPRAVLYRKVQTTPSLMQVMKEIEAENVDTVEYRLLEQAKEGVLPAVIFFLKTKGANRGYSDSAIQVNSLDVGNAATLIEMLHNSRKKQLEDKSQEIEVEWRVKSEENQDPKN
jgi:hypothetical protein